MSETSPFIVWSKNHPEGTEVIRSTTRVAAAYTYTNQYLRLRYAQGLQEMVVCVLDPTDEGSAPRQFRMTLTLDATGIEQ